MNINEETVRGLSLLVIDNSISQVLENRKRNVILKDYHEYSRLNSILQHI